MIKASALYFVIIIALVIGLICSFLVMAAHLYNAQYQRKFRYDRLQNNMNSGINILLASKDTAYNAGRAFDLFNGSDDSVMLRRSNWGIYEVNVSEAFKQRDTLFKVFTTARLLDSSKWAALYVIDEDRPISVSGKTLIKGTAFVPAAGIRPAYVDGKSYTGDRRLVIGEQKKSKRELPQLDEERLKKLRLFFFNNVSSPAGRGVDIPDTVTRSYLQPVLELHFGKKIDTVRNTVMSGNIILYSDSLLVIDSTARLHHVLVFAKAILVRSGFQGDVQLFASDSIGVERNCRFNYPSCLGVLRYKDRNKGLPPQINIGAGSWLEGSAFTYVEDNPGLSSMITLGKKTIIRGQVYAQHITQAVDSVEIDGAIFTGRFLYQNNFTRFENYLINLTVNSDTLSRYYLTSELFPVASPKKRILQWIETK